MQFLKYKCLNLITSCIIKLLGRNINNYNLIIYYILFYTHIKLKKDYGFVVNFLNKNQCKKISNMFMEYSILERCYLNKSEVIVEQGKEFLFFP